MQIIKNKKNKNMRTKHTPTVQLSKMCHLLKDFFFPFCIITEKVARRVISCKDGCERKTLEFSLERKHTNGIEGDEGERGQGQTNAVEWGRGRKGAGAGAGVGGGLMAVL